MNTLPGLVVDLYKPWEQETRPWSDPEYNPLNVDHSWEGEYRLWIFDYEDFINANIDLIAEHHDTFQMRPRVQDLWGNWRRAPNIFGGLDCDCDDVEVEFLSPREGNIKQFINLTNNDNLPDHDFIPYEERGRNVDVWVKVRTINNKILPDGTRLIFSWDDPHIDETPFTTESSNPPGERTRPYFPWLSDPREACDCGGNNSPCEVWAYSPGEYFPDPANPPSNCLPSGYPHMDNSYPCISCPSGEHCFSTLEPAYGHTFTYQKPGYGPNQEFTYEVGQDWLCRDEFFAEFYTSNFGGDNYILTVKVKLPTRVPGQYIICDKVQHNGVINVWRKAYIEPAFMAGTTETRNDVYFDREGLEHTYTHFNGPYIQDNLTYIHNAFDDCFIDVKFGKDDDNDTTFEDNMFDEEFLINYADDETYFHAPNRQTSHCYQVLYCDHTKGRPHRFSPYLGFSVRPQEERHHSAIAIGSINDIFVSGIDYLVINDLNTNSEYEISGMATSHEIGHLIAFYGASDLASGHFSGKGIMYSPFVLPQGCNQIENAASYFWGDHVFVMRLDPNIR